MEDTTSIWLAIIGIAGTIIGVLIGSIVTGWFNRQNIRDQIKHAEHMAIFEKRMEAHQEAYSLSYEMLMLALQQTDKDSEVNVDLIHSNILKFLNNITVKRLYLGGTVFTELTEMANVMRRFTEGGAQDDVVQQWADVSATILKAMDLPAAQQEGIIRAEPQPPSPPA